MKHLLVAAFSLYMFVWFSCGSSSADNKTESIVSVKWYLASINGKTIESKTSDFEIPYVVFSKEKEFTGFTGCNNFVGNYKYENGKLSLDAGSITKKYCGDSFEMEFLDALKKVSAFENKNNNLVLLNGGQEILKFTPKK